MASTNLFVRGTTGTSKCNVHPVVLFNIVDHFSRRNEGAEMVIGTLLGVRHADGSVEVKNSFPVPFEDQMDSVAVDTNYHKVLFDLHKKVSAKETIVGWYSSSPEVNESTAIIHSFYADEAKSPVHLTLDCALKSGSLNLKAFIANDVNLEGARVATQFVPIPCEKTYTAEEKSGVDYLKRLQSGSRGRRTSEMMFNDLEGLDKSMRKLIELVDDVHEHVGKILSGEEEPNPKLGRHLMDTIMELPKLKLEQFEEAFQQNLQDLLMVAYLSTLTRAQLHLAAKFPKA
uniref:Eukaryotic translation initiation factor 3 subunit F n=1 Tax=Palpitomonas bilix TaxID=652834 RepID=A0A7S3D2Q0_9EUKA|mmetsp:Transcript_19490/g.49936  ORF Transcript_19490/g.49936 Transcript_19490/m.49936 type:complete len:287 (+) Transcript_19490:129-989(+)|eukprot:CAMPEP_0113886564 /NCGR_PEP_ID=MMETSP0780_2-20120614/11632_1 /TAXON_ID=652834 /ORGANISM="Palpitomonas bilix" /LENGTH=286 /DNA_ID=CAMNT_0000874807 /DNA_START=126 /DNA_END=986 /DNA_ORIENTATION=- /assembly_acc=CAM_ASM_000599